VKTILILEMLLFGKSGAYTINDKYTLRSSFLQDLEHLHCQIYTKKAQYSFVPGQGIQVGGLVNNVSSQAGLLGIPKLKEETSTNLHLVSWKSE
jgi:iron complex outermembrane receptor protein